MYTEPDIQWMRQALSLAAKGLGRTRPNPPVGAVVVNSGQLKGSGYHAAAGREHAEVAALSQAGSRAAGGTLYVTLEPCSNWGRTPPCTEAIVRSRIKRVVIGVPDSNAINGGKGTAALRSSGIQVETGLCALQISSMLAPYSKWAGRGIPHVALKLATSLDGRIADYRYASKWITGDVSRSRVRRMREAADAVMVGAATALHDDPGLEDGSPDKGRLLRVIVDSSGSLPLSSRVLNSESPASTIIVTTARCKPERIEEYRGRGARVWQMPSFQGHVCLKSLMARLGEEGVHSVLCEGGGRLAGSLMSGGFVDEYVFFIAPIILGGGGSMASVAGVGKTLADAWRLKYVLQRSVGSDLLVVAVPAAVHDERVSFMAHVLSEQEDCSCLPD